MTHKIMDKFYELLKESVIVQSTITLVLIIVLAILIIQGRPIPDFLTLLVGTVMGFYFGTKVRYLQTK